MANALPGDLICYSGHVPCISVTAISYMRPTAPPASSFQGGLQENFGYPAYLLKQAYGSIVSGEFVRLKRIEKAI